MMKKRLWGAMLLALVPMAALAGDEENYANAPTATGETGYFTLFTGSTLPQGQWSFGLYYNNWDRVVIPDRLTPLPVGSNLSSEWDYDFHRLSASVGYGITDNFELSLMLPYDRLDANDFNRFGRVNGRFFENDLDASGIGNVRLGAKWRLFSSEDNLSHFALNAFVEAPTGDEDEGVATGDTGFGVGLAYDVRGWALNLGYRDPGDPDNVDVPAEVLAGVGYAIAVSDNLDWITELAATVYTGGDEQPDDNIDLATGGRLWLGEEKHWAFNFGLRADIGQLDNTDEFCPIGGLVGMTYFPRPPRYYTLTLIPEGAGKGRVVSDPPGIDCGEGGSACSADFKKGTVVTLRALPVLGSLLKGWSGDCAGGTMTMDGDKTCTTTFDLEPPRMLTVVKKCDGTGTVTSSPAGIDCGSTCSAKFDWGTAVTLTARPDGNSKFSSWGSACANGSVKMTEDRTCDVCFSSNPPPTPPPPPPVIEEVCQFGSNSARVDNRCKATLDEVALRMKQETERFALVIGYSDSPGSESANQKMSLKRAEAVRNYLVTRHGIDTNRISTEGRGEADPVGDNTTRDGRAKNRRAVIILKVQ